jgi:hypothetical protein
MKKYFCGSSEILDLIYTENGEKEFLNFCEKFLKVKIKWVEERGQYLVE